MPSSDFRPFGALRSAFAQAGGSDADHHAAGLRPLVSSERGGALRASVPWLAGLVQPTVCTQPHSGTLPGGGQCASGAGRADGGSFRPYRSGQPDAGLGFERTVPPGGYAWWYVDALSDDGRYGLSIIAFIGSVFSPYYAWARRRGAADPRDHCAFNIALYGPGHNRDTLSIDLDEVTVPWPSRIRGQVRLHPNALTHYSANLDSQGQHRWHPISPCARVDVKLQSPALRWSGAGYFDRNEGTVPLESSLVSWDWSRTQLREGTAVIYDVTPRYGRSVALALHFDRLGRACDLISPPLVQLPRSKWGIRRSVRAGDGQAEVLRTVEDTPFYARSLLSSRFLGEQVKSIHESLDLDRFSKLWVQAMLPFRMPRSLR